MTDASEHLQTSGAPAASTFSLVAFGARVRIRRRILGLTQQQVADVLEITQTHFSQMERGHVGKIGILNVHALARTLRTSTDYLFCLTDADPGLLDAYLESGGRIDQARLTPPP